MTVDPARRSYLAEGNAKQARKRVATNAVIRDQAGRILLVDPTYKPDWDIPGGMAEANEPPTAAIRRELLEELGLDITVGRLLHLEWAPPHDPWDDQLVFLFDAGTLTESQIAIIHLADDELRAWEFVTPPEAKTRLRPYVHERLVAALAALRDPKAESYHEAPASISPAG